VEMMHGSIEVESKPGEGSTFHFTVRLGKMIKEQDPQPAESGDSVREPRLDVEARRELTSLNILVAEDNFSNLKLVTRILESWGQRITIAVDGRETLRLFEEQNFDLIVLDIQMPEMDGLEVAAAIRQSDKKKHRDTPILALTAHAGPEMREQCFAAGMDYFLTKPIQPRKLFDALKTVGVSQKP
jgi:CheY-like chemotaxis protein